MTLTFYGPTIRNCSPYGIETDALCRSCWLDHKMNNNKHKYLTPECWRCWLDALVVYSDHQIFCGGLRGLPPRPIGERQQTPDSVYEEWNVSNVHSMRACEWCAANMNQQFVLRFNTKHTKKNPKTPPVLNCINFNFFLLMPFLVHMWRHYFLWTTVR